MCALFLFQESQCGGELGQFWLKRNMISEKQSSAMFREGAACEWGDDNMMTTVCKEEGNR